MDEHKNVSGPTLYKKIRRGQIRLGGNRRLKIYGTLSCASGKRMKRGNRVFFETKMEAQSLGYRQCGNCMRKEYLDWKNGPV